MCLVKKNKRKEKREMTVRELINELENYDDDQEVMIGQFQTYGSDWCYTISEVKN